MSRSNLSKGMTWDKAKNINQRNVKKKHKKLVRDTNRDATTVNSASTTWTLLWRSEKARKLNNQGIKAYI
jgi:hypothetical protein